jgi:hypothetical protein
MGCVHTKILFCDTTKEKLNQRSETGGGINYKACAMLRIENPLYATNVATYTSSMVMDIEQNQVKRVPSTLTCFDTGFSSTISFMQLI